MTAIINGTDGITYPSWTTATRPASPSTGQMGYNTTYGGIELYNGSAWTTMSGGPAFLAYASAVQTVTTNTDTKVIFSSETFDTNNNFASSTFTPTVAGYYQLNTSIRFNNNSNTQYVVYWYKNGASIGIPLQTNVTQGSGYIVTASTLLYLNGTTDYMEVWVSTTGTTPTIGAASGNPNNNYFSGFLARGV